MVKSEALSYLGITHEADLEARRNELLFETKQFFTKQPLIRQVFERKLEKIRLQQKAFSLFGLMENESEGIKSMPFVEGSNLIEQFNHSQLQKAKFYSAIYNSTGYNGLINNVQELLNFYDDFLFLWEWPFESQEDIIIGKEEDAMQLLVDLKKLRAIGVYTMNELIQKHDSCPETLKRELVRMNKLKKRNANGRGV